MTPADYPDRVRALLLESLDPIARLSSPHHDRLRDEAPTLARAYLDLHAEVERLTRVLAVECGDVTQVRPGWRRENSLEWSGPGERWVWRSRPGRWVWVCGSQRGEARTAYEAMEAADRAVGGSDV